MLLPARPSGWGRIFSKLGSIFAHAARAASESRGRFSRAPLRYVWRSRRGVVRAARTDEQRHFGKAHPEIFTVPSLSGSAKKVYYYLSRTADEDGYALPFVRTIASRTHLSKSAVAHALTELEAGGFVTRTRRYSRRGGSSNIYRLRPPT